MRHIAGGMSPAAAVDLAYRECFSVRTLGDDLIEPIQQQVAKVSSVVSPWLWVLSVGSFAMAVLNKAEISKMYGSWKRARQQLLR